MAHIVHDYLPGIGIDGGSKRRSFSTDGLRMTL